MPAELPQARPDVLDFLLTRRSRPPQLLRAPGPERAELLRLLTAATRTPDHGKLEPWRFIVLQGDARLRFAEAIRARGIETGKDGEKCASAFAGPPVTVAVIAVPKDDSKVPRIEQTLSAAGVCLGLVNAALAAGWGASWLTGWPAYDADFLSRELGLAAGEWIAGFVHIGACETIPPERPRPDVPSLVTWRDG